MFILKSLNKFGEYILLMGKVFSIPDRWSEFFRRYIMEVYQLVIDSIAIVVTISLFIGAVIAIQTSLNIMSVDSPLYGRFNNERYPPARILIIYNVPYPRRKNRL